MAQKSPTIDDVIRGAFPLVKNQKTWVAGRMAEDCEGLIVSCIDPRAVRWCAHGALRKVAFALTGDWFAADALQLAASRKLTKDLDRTLPCVNDYDGHDAVVALFKKALAAA